MQDVGLWLNRGGATPGLIINCKQTCLFLSLSMFIGNTMGNISQAYLSYRMENYDWLKETNQINLDFLIIKKNRHIFPVFSIILIGVSRNDQSEQDHTCTCDFWSN